MNIRELAKEAGVSVATISRVINHPEAVLPETRERVQTIIEKYNYNPKPVNRGRRAVTLIVPAAKRAQTLLSGVQSVLAPKGILVNLVEFSPLSGGIAACIQAAAAAKPSVSLVPFSLKSRGASSAFSLVRHAIHAAKGTALIQ